MARLNEHLFNQAVFNEYQDINSEAQIEQGAASEPRRSHLLQHLLNYFDDADSHVRRGTSTLDAQLLNPLASAVEGLTHRFGREIGALNLFQVPLNIDNGGVYHKVQVLDTYEFQAAADGTLVPPKVRVQTNDGDRWKTIPQLNDQLPVPAGVAVGGEGVPCTSLLVLDLSGGPDMIDIEAGKLDWPNYLWVKISGLDADEHDIEIRLEGWTHPTLVSLSGQPKTQEIIRLTDENLVRTTYAWSELKRVIVRGLPAGARLRMAVSPFAFGMETDPLRPAHHPDFRDNPLVRYWKLEGSYLKEEGFIDRLSGFEHLQSYLCEPLMQCFALEPNTYGLFAITDTSLVYMDRREPMPANLDRTGLFREPFYNLLVYADGAHTGPGRRVVLDPVRNAMSVLAYRHRFAMETPEGKKFAVSSDGQLIAWSENTGWRTGTPKPVSLPVSEQGSYLFFLESADEEGTVTSDVAAYANLTTKYLFKADVSEILPQVHALVFDRFQRLWAWTGELMIPLVLVYDNYVFDQASRSIYLTRPYRKVELS